MADAPDIDAWLGNARFGALSTLLEGAPFGSVVPFARAEGGAPLLYLSDLAVHTKGLRADPRCSLLVVDPTAADPQQSWRVTLVGRARVDDSLESGFFTQHPGTQRLGGFHTWTIDVERTRFIAGFGHMGWL